MKYQLEPWFCGPASLGAATRALGKPVSQRKLATYAGTTEGDGTDEEGLKRATLASGFVFEVLDSNLATASRNWLTVKLRLGYPVLLCHGGLRWEHWVCAVGMLGTRFLIFDPARYEYRMKNGIEFFTWDKLRKVWYANKQTRGVSGSYWAMAVLNKG